MHLVPTFLNVTVGDFSEGIELLGLATCTKQDTGVIHHMTNSHAYLSKLNGGSF